MRHERTSRLGLSSSRDGPRREPRRGPRRPPARPPHRLHRVPHRPARRPARQRRARCAPSSSRPTARGRAVLAEELTRRTGHLDAVRRLVAGRQAGDRLPRLGEPRERASGRRSTRRSASRPTAGSSTRYLRRPRDRQGDERDRRRAGQPPQRAACSSCPATRRSLGFTGADRRRLAPVRDGPRRHGTSATRARASRSSPTASRVSRRQARSPTTRPTGSSSPTPTARTPAGRDRPAVQLRARVVARRRWVLFLAGEHYDCHPTSSRPDGTGLRSSPTATATGAWIDVPRRPRLPRRQQRLAGLVARRPVRLLHRQGGHQRRAVPRHARRQAEQLTHDAGRLAALPPAPLARRQAGWPTARSATASGSCT